ncbi:MAG: M48 family metalloprotease [Candidatus Nitrohelix vancouverensis]|uniref:M48 family metalloprotease n=1 Tax=Candidatus Nitrohelix vancouverensis TaxID=2705534 RepID=A0A7T0C1G4_9BACT|nr:MAG: M48 family metalloprotease [Candidatus Nitrohelix vancouverensis]
MNTSSRWIRRLALILLLGYAPFAYAFSLGDLGRTLEKLEKKPAPQEEPKQQEPAKQPSQTENHNDAEGEEPGLIDLGGALFGVDNKTTGRIKQGLQGFQKLQPLTYDEEKEIGGMLAVEAFNKFGGAYANPKLERYVNLIGKNLAEVSNRPDIDYHFAIIDTQYPNAFATPGGYVLISRGLIEMLQNEAQLAGVLGHEIAHVSNKHALSAIEENRKLQGIGSIANAASGKKLDLLDQLIAFSSQLIFEKGLDPKLEYEADRYGTEFAYRLGYHPKGLLESLKILGQSQESKQSVFNKTHPSFSNRYGSLTKAMGRYQNSAQYPLLAKRFVSFVSPKP